MDSYGEYEEYEVKFVENRDLEVIEGWWNHHGNKDYDLPISLLSDFGIMIEGQAAGFLYETNSKLCFADHIIVNPDLSRDEREKAIEMLMDLIIESGANKGYEAMFINVNIPKLHARCKKKGFIDLGEMYYMGRSLCQA